MSFGASECRSFHGVSIPTLNCAGWAITLKFDAPLGKIILTVTRLVASEGYKGVDHVIQAMPNLLRLVPDVTYVVVGDGDDRPRLAALAVKLGVAGRVVFAGMRTDDEVALYHSTADLYAMPSRGEGFGIVFLEAMACNKPVVAAHAAATPELVRHQETGLLVDYGDVPELTRGLARLLLDADLSKQMGQKGRERVIAVLYLCAFQEAAEQPPRGTNRVPRRGTPPRLIGRANTFCAGFAFIMALLLSETMRLVLDKSNEWFKSNSTSYHPRALETKTCA